jgi:hypothetical protein
MKFKYAVAVVGITISLATSFAFMPGKKRSWLTIFYHPSGDKTLIQPGQTNSLVSSEMVTPGYWNSTSIQQSSSGTKLAAIQFPEDDQADGAGDGAVTSTEAINFLEEYYTAQDPFNLPANNTPFRVQVDATHFTDITVFRKD